jgi:hypothetical protein
MGFTCVGQTSAVRSPDSGSVSEKSDAVEIAEFFVFNRPSGESLGVNPVTDEPLIDS